MIDFSLFPDTVGIVGSRQFPQPAIHSIVHFVGQLKPGTTVISGGAKGVDMVAERAAKGRGLPVISHLIDMKKVYEYESQNIPFRSAFSKAAKERNTIIVMDVKKRGGLVVAFLLDPPISGGTNDSITKCVHYDVPCLIFPVTKEGRWLAPKANQTMMLHEKWMNILKTT